MSNQIDQITEEEDNVEVKTGLKAGHWREERWEYNQRPEWYRHHHHYPHDYRHHRWW